MIDLAEVPARPPEAERVLLDDPRYEVYDHGRHRWRYDIAGVLVVYIEYNEPPAAHPWKRLYLHPSQR